MSNTIWLTDQNIADTDTCEIDPLSKLYCCYYYILNSRKGLESDSLAIIRNLIENERLRKQVVAANKYSPEDMKKIGVINECLEN